jgi:hypothetical protein
MKPRYYYGATLILFALELVGSLLVEDIGSIFEVVGSFANSMLTFIWPGLFYILAEK